MDSKDFLLRLFRVGKKSGKSGDDRRGGPGGSGGGREGAEGRLLDRLFDPVLQFWVANKIFKVNCDWKLREVNHLMGQCKKLPYVFQNPRNIFLQWLLGGLIRVAICQWALWSHGLFFKLPPKNDERLKIELMRRLDSQATLLRKAFLKTK